MIRLELGEKRAFCGFVVIEINYEFIFVIEKYGYDFF